MGVGGCVCMCVCVCVSVCVVCVLCGVSFVSGWDIGGWLWGRGEGGWWWLSA